MVKYEINNVNMKYIDKLITGLLYEKHPIIFMAITFDTYISNECTPQYSATFCTQCFCSLFKCDKKNPNIISVAGARKYIRPNVGNADLCDIYIAK